jgi:hypothetical protein
MSTYMKAVSLTLILLFIMCLVLMIELDQVSKGEVRLIVPPLSHPMHLITS